MCGRFTVTSPGDVAAEFGVEVPLELSPRYNVAPTDPVAVIVDKDGRRAELMRWGLVPHWAKDRSIASKMINARAESLDSRPAFRDALSRRRCLIPADGFYEWKREGKHRTPYYVHLPDRRLFAFAGLWERWKQPDGEWLITFTIITTDANDLVAPIHDRMPLIVDPADYERWLDPEPTPREALDDILAGPSPPVVAPGQAGRDPRHWWGRPANPPALEMFEVSRLVNSVRNEGPQLVEPAVGQ